jgi:hypothetical protein
MDLRKLISIPCDQIQNFRSGSEAQSRRSPAERTASRRLDGRADVTVRAARVVDSMGYQAPLPRLPWGCEAYPSRAGDSSVLSGGVPDPGVPKRHVFPACMPKSRHGAVDNPRSDA